MSTEDIISTILLAIAALCIMVGLIGFMILKITERKHKRKNFPVGYLYITSEKEVYADIHNDLFKAEEGDLVEFTVRRINSL